MTFYERKQLKSYHSVAVVGADHDLGVTRVFAFHPSIQDAKESMVRIPYRSRVGLYVRHDEPEEPIVGDFQI